MLNNHIYMYIFCLGLKRPRSQSSQSPVPESIGLQQPRPIVPNAQESTPTQLHYMSLVQKSIQPVHTYDSINQSQNQMACKYNTHIHLIVTLLL